MGEYRQRMSSHNGQHSEADEPLTVRTWRADNTVVVVAVGELDILTAPQLRRAVSECLREPFVPTVVLDLTGLTFAGSHGLALLMEMTSESKRINTAFRVVVGEQSGILRVLEVVGLDKELPLYPNVEKALAPE